MDDQSQLGPQLKTSQLLRDSFSYAKERLPEILSSQFLYFVLLLLISLASTYSAVDVNEHAVQIKAMVAVEEAVKKSGGKPDLSLVNEELNKLYLAFAKVFAMTALLYFLGRSFVHNLYDGLSKGAAFPRFTIFPVQKNVWRLMQFDLKIAVAIFIPIFIATVVTVMLMTLGGALKVQLPSFVSVMIITLLPLAIVGFVFFKCMILMAAQPSVYEHAPISLMKHFYPATKGYRWKIFIAKMGVMMPMIIINTVLTQLIRNNVIGSELVSTFIVQTGITAVASWIIIWDVYLSVMLWQHIAPKARALAAAPPA